MAQVYVKYNPYRLETTLMVNGRDISKDSILYKVTKGKRLQEWILKVIPIQIHTAKFKRKVYSIQFFTQHFREITNRL